jgi:glycosyltransferase involved in cell wall biosynthesis
MLKESPGKLGTIMHTGLKRHMPYVSIVIPTYNRAELLRECVESVLRLDYPQDGFEVIIVDDGSNDATGAQIQSLLRRCGKRIQAVRHPDNRGVAAARNLGREMARGDIIVFLDDDCRPEVNWLARIMAVFRSYPRAAAVGGSVVNAGGSALSRASYIIEFSSWFPAGAVRRIKNIPGCNSAYKADEIKNHRFPEAYKGMGFEDSLFNHGLIRGGKIIMFAPHARVIHHKWSSDRGWQCFVQDQRRYALGFLKGGYTVFGLWGKILFHCRFLNLLCPRLILVFFRCARSPQFLSVFFRNLGQIVRGEWLRGKIVFRN